MSYTIPTCAIHGTALQQQWRDGSAWYYCPYCTTAASGFVPIPFRAPVPSAPAPEATREADADKLLDELVRSIGDPAAFRVARERLRAALAARAPEPQS